MTSQAPIESVLSTARPHPTSCYMMEPPLYAPNGENRAAIHVAMANSDIPECSDIPAGTSCFDVECKDGIYAQVFKGTTCPSKNSINELPSGCKATSGFIPDGN